jgi:hypothetical protein
LLRFSMSPVEDSSGQQERAVTTERIRGSSERSTLLLAGRPTHGYALMKEVAQFTSLGLCRIAGAP